MYQLEKFPEPKQGLEACSMFQVLVNEPLL